MLKTQSYEEDIDITDIWRDYEKGVIFNRRKNLYLNTEKNYNFYHGKQWEGASLGGIQPMVFNIIKGIVKYKLGVLNTNYYEIVFNPNLYNTVEEGKLLNELCKILNRYTAKLWENKQVGKKIKTVLKDACINSEGILHCYYNKNNNEVETEVIDKNNICYGNENDSDIQSQPYIIISYRKPVETVKQEAKDLGLNQEQIDLITSDSEVREQSGYSSTTDEVNQMCLVVLKYFKKDGKVYYSKGTKNVTLEKDENTELSLYPVSHLVWEELKGSARGIGAVETIIPNQIEINKLDARRAVAVKIGAFQKLVVNEDLISNSKDLDKVGSTIKIKGNTGIEDVRKAVGYLQPSSMSADASNLSNEIKSNTKDLEGASDTVTGTVDPTQASGRAILAVQQANQQPLNEQVDGFKYFIEDTARIFYAMWKAYYVNGMQITFEQKDADGNVSEQPGLIPYNLLEQIELNIKVDITPRSSYDRLAQEQTIENLLSGGYITLEEYAMLLDEDSTMSRSKLEKLFTIRKEKQEKIAKIQQEAQQKEMELQELMRQQQNNANQKISEIENLGNNTQNGFNELLKGDRNDLSQM